MPLSRDKRIEQLAQKSQQWEAIVIGGGASGIASALDLASRGIKTLLLESHDFTSETSSRSTKLIHGGVRYLEQGHFGLVKEALRERKLLLLNAGEIITPLPFFIPTKGMRDSFYYRAGLKAYDLLARNETLPPSSFRKQSEIEKFLPHLSPEHQRQGVSYWDAQFDDCELALAMVRTFESLGGLALNYSPVTELIHNSRGQLTGLITQPKGKAPISLGSQTFINATGPFSDKLRQQDNPKTSPRIITSRGSHLVFPAALLGAQHALLIPKTKDGRVLFAVPWKGVTLLGTTDIPIAEATRDPQPSAQEVDFILNEARPYLPVDQHEILASFAGFRPLVKRHAHQKSARISRSHLIEKSPSGMISLMGGKWTTARQMGEEVGDQISDMLQYKKPSQTATLPLLTHPGFYQQKALSWSKKARWAIENDHALTVEDFIARRTRLSFLDSQQAQLVQKEVSSLFL